MSSDMQSERARVWGCSRRKDAGRDEALPAGQSKGI